MQVKVNVQQGDTTLSLASSHIIMHILKRKIKLWFQRNCN